MTTITPGVTRAFWRHMLAKFDAAVVQKDSSTAMHLAASMLDLVDIQDEKQFMEHFVTTLHKTIYIPFEIGVATDDWPLWNQIEVCCHECVHVLQCAREGVIVYDTRYLSSSSYRAGYEAEAYGCNLEMEYWLTGRILDSPARAGSLKFYGCSTADIEQAIHTLEIRAGVIKQGVIETLPAQEAITWLEAQQ
jgi:hypothetical protein